MCIFCRIFAAIFMKRSVVIIWLLLIVGYSLRAQNQQDSIMWDAYLREDMSVWKAYVDNHSTLLYEYGFCGYLVGEYKEGRADLQEAKSYVAKFKSAIINHKSSLPIGHYEMYMSAVYVYEMRLHESVRPFKAMNLAKEAVRKAPDDPLTLAYYATCLFYAPKPFGSKQEALTYFEKADRLFQNNKWRYCWVREATNMYIAQCHEKLKKQ